MTINADTIRNIRRGHEQLRSGLKDKLSKSDYVEAITQAIENRQEAMRKRQETYLKHKLNNFFWTKLRWRYQTNEEAVLSSSEQCLYL